jgi:hypothetical protein
LNRSAGVSEAEARRRNPERSEGTSGKYLSASAKPMRGAFAKCLKQNVAGNNLSASHPAIYKKPSCFFVSFVVKLPLW